MRILFDLTTTIEIPDADKFPPKEETEEELAEFFTNEGMMIVHGLEITDYAVLTNEQEGKK